MANKKKAATSTRKPRGGFTQVYNSFLDTDMLTQYEKLVFIAIKSYANNKTKQAFPSLATISRVTGTSISQVRRCIEHLKQLGVIEVEHRKSELWGNIQNLYTVHDDPAIWNVEISEEDDIEAVAQEISDARLIAELKKRGYSVTKDIKKEPVSDTDQSIETDAFRKQYVLNNSNTSENDRQEQYTMEFLQEHFYYDVMTHDHPDDKSMIDYVIQIIYDTLNSGGNTVRVQKTSRPKSVVASVLMKLTYDEIIYVIQKYKKQITKIKYPKPYMLTQLYEASGQHHADITNQVQHDMYGNEE